MQFVYLAIAILAEVVGTTALKASNGFTVWQPSLVVVIGYGIAHAIWSGMGLRCDAKGGPISAARPAGPSRARRRTGTAR